MKPSKIRAPFQSKGLTYAKNGMVATANKAATIEALRVLMEGGNAFDAALTAATVTNVTMPACCQLGGDAFAVVYSAKDRRFWAMNGSGVGQNVTVAEMRERGYAKMPVGGPLAIALPGAADVYDKLTRFTTLPLSRLLEPAIRYARDGFFLGAVECNYIGMGAHKVLADPDCRAIFAPGGATPRPGDTLVQKNLAASFERIVKKGFRDVYDGELGDAIFESLAKKGALFTREQFRAHQTEMCEPLSVRYRGHDVLVTPPPSQGMILATELRILEGFPLSDYGHNSTRAIHAMVEAKKQAFASRMRWAGDPRCVTIPWDEILSDAAVERARGRIRMDRAMTKEEFQEMLLPESAGDTTSFVVADKEGNAVSFIHSLSNVMGSGVVAGDTGITLNNRAGRGFVLIDGHPNCLAPGKRTMHTLLTWIIAKDGRPAWIGNTPGGDNQPQWGMQAICNLLDFGFNEEQAVSAPRWYNYPGTDPEHADNPFVLNVEAGVPELSCYELAALGHDVEVIGRYDGGGAQSIIRLREDGALVGGTDPRTDGDVLGY
ncbi:MAG: gamma-glutamyltransferase family protein [Duodenibacillus sp.]|nr:gamma-glutamyltransferase family protein [Duodenibacillus sp.]